MAFVDFISYLKEKLSDISDKVYTISNERQLDSDAFEGEIIVRALSGSVYDESATIPYQIDVTTADPAKVMEDFTQLAINCNNKTFTSIIHSDNENYNSYTITPFFNTPVVMENDIRFGSNVYTRIVVFATLNVTNQVSNVESIKIDGEDIEFLSANISYTAELISNRISGTQLNANKKRTASTLLTITMIHKASIFTNKLFRIIFGNLEGNTSFSTEVKMSNGLTSTMNMVVGSVVDAFARQQLPTCQVSLFIYDNRGDNNNA